MGKPINLNKYDQGFIYDLDPPLPAWRFVAKFDGPAIPGVDFNDLLVESISGPNGEKLGVEPIFGAGRTIYYPSFPEVDSINVAIYETDSAAANLSLDKWHDAILSPVGWYGLPSEYKCRLIANVFGYSSNVQPVRTYSFEGVWPNDPGGIELTYTDDQRIIINASFSVDRVITRSRAG